MRWTGTGGSSDRMGRGPGRRIGLSPAGVAVGGILFALSLFPSLLPRGSVAQGLVSGVLLAAGYGIGVLARWTWRELGLPLPTGRPRQIVIAVMLSVLVVAISAAMWRHVGWQNDVRLLMGIAPTTPATWPPLALVALSVAAALLALARGIRRSFRSMSTRLGRRLPARQARVAATFVALLVAWGLWNGVIVTGFFALANQVSAPRDAATDVGVVPPVSPTRSGSPDSLVAWDSLGRKGRSFVATGPTLDDLERFSGGGSREPIRVYAGLRSADTTEARADLVLAELRRTDAFTRSVLVVASTTGTGFLDPHGVDPIEYLHNGDTAIVGVQYSYLPSWISLLADQDAVRSESLAVFDTIHDHWASVPEATRPRLYLYGMSLGSLGAEAVLTSPNILNEPVDGALLVGPPFVDGLHDRLIETRNPGTPPWLPVHDTGRTVRFMARGTEIDTPSPSGEPWGPTRVVYLQNSSDPVVWFDPDIAIDKPDWLLDSERGPDLSDHFAWTPVVTMWEVFIDLPAAASVPDGYGHNYTVADNTRAWAAITGPDGWTEADTQRLADQLATSGQP